MKMRKVNAGLGDLYFFPDEGQAPEDVSVTVNWGPYQDNRLQWVHYPFRPGGSPSGLNYMRPVNYPGRTHAKNPREAAKIAHELFSHSFPCLNLEHDECKSKYDSHLGPLADWPDAPKCECECHQGVS